MPRRRPPAQPKRYCDRGCGRTVRTVGQTTCATCRTQASRFGGSILANAKDWRDLHKAWADIVPLTLEREQEEQRRE